MKLLAIDGGGIRGIYAASVLAKIKNEFGLVFHRDFDLIAGTSTGSIIAAALAIGMPIEKIIRLYQDKSSLIFNSRRWSIGGLLFPKYSTAPLTQVLDEVFGGALMKSSRTRLIIPTTDIGNGDVHVVKSAYDPLFDRDPNRRIVDVVAASCSAPLFFSPKTVDKYLLCDGGLWANNPSVVAVTEALTRLNARKEDIRLLSIGTGLGQEFYSVDGINWGWGFVAGWKMKKFISMLINLQTKSAEDVSELLLTKEQMVRISFDSDGALSLDDLGVIDALVQQADQDFLRNKDRIQRWIEGGK